MWSMWGIQLNLHKHNFDNVVFPTDPQGYCMFRPWLMNMRCAALFMFGRTILQLNLIIRSIAMFEGSSV